MSDLVDIDVLKKLFSYDPETGVLTWLERQREFFETNRACSTWNARYAGKQAFTANDKHGYKQGQIFGKIHRAHRVVWALYYGSWPANQIDHINGDRADNRIKNLRDVTNSENSRNQKFRSTNSSGVMGVHWYSTRKKWVAHLTVNGRYKNLGYFSDINDAIAARKAAEKEYGFHQNHGRQEMLR
jgi:hypothetical protein